ncbi:MAG: DUF4199 domain-containing protein [Bacteroidota bacterium]
MNTNTSEFIEESTVSFWSVVIKYGVIGGLLVVVYKYINYTTFFSTASMGGAIAAFLINLLLFGGLIYLATKEHRDQQLGGYLTMGRAIVVGIFTVLFASVIGGVFDYIYMAFIDPEIQVKLSRNLTWMYEIMGLDEDQIEDAMDAVEETQMKPSIFTAIGGAAFGGAMTGVILSAIVGAIMKKNPPKEEF